MISLRNPRCAFKISHLIALDIGKNTGSEFDNNRNCIRINWIRTNLDPNLIIKTRSKIDPNKTLFELDNNLILQYLVLDEVYSASFGSNFNQIIQLQ